MKRQLIAVVLAVGVSGIPVAAQESAVANGWYKTTKNEQKAAETPPIDSDDDPTRPCYPDCRKPADPLPQVPIFRPKPSPAPLVQVERQPLSRNLQMAGAWIMIGSIFFFASNGSTVRVAGDNYCVETDTQGFPSGDVHDGGCSSNSVKWGLRMLMIGAPLLAVGSIKVTRRVKVAVAPSPTGVSASATVKW